MSVLRDKIGAFKVKQAEIMGLKQQLDTKMAEYKAEMKETFGITDGEPANVLELIAAFDKVQDLK